MHKWNCYNWKKGKQIIERANGWSKKNHTKHPQVYTQFFFVYKLKTRRVRERCKRGNVQKFIYTNTATEIEYSRAHTQPANEDLLIIWLLPEEIAHFTNRLCICIYTDFWLAVFIARCNREIEKKKPIWSEIIAKLTRSHMLCDLMLSDDMYPTSKRLIHISFHFAKISYCCALFSCFDSDWLLRFVCAVLLCFFFYFGFKRVQASKKRLDFLISMQSGWLSLFCPHGVSSNNNNTAGNNNNNKNRHFNLKKLSVKHVPFRYSTDIMSHWFFQFTGDFCYFQKKNICYWMKLYRFFV